MPIPSDEKNAIIFALVLDAQIALDDGSSLDDRLFDYSELRRIFRESYPTCVFGSDLAVDTNQLVEAELISPVDDKFQYGEVVFRSLERLGLYFPPPRYDP